MGWSPRITLAESSAGDAVIRHLFTRGLNNEQGMQQYLVVLVNGRKQDREGDP